MSTVIKKIEEVISNQLKAYYLSHVDVNLIKVSDALELNQEWVFFTFPEWVVPFCSIIAACIALVKIFKSGINWFSGKKK